MIDNNSHANNGIPTSKGFSLSEILSGFTGNDLPTSESFSLSEIFSGLTFNEKLTLKSYLRCNLWPMELAEQFFDGALNSIQENNDGTYSSKYPYLLGQITLNTQKADDGIIAHNIVGGHQEIMTTILMFKVVADLAAVYNKPGIRNYILSIICMFDSNDKKIPKISTEKKLDQEDLEIITSFLPHSPKDITPKTIRTLAKNMSEKIDTESPLLNNYYIFLQIMNQAATTGYKGHVYSLEYLLHTVLNMKMLIFNLPEGMDPQLAEVLVNDLN